MIPLTYSNCSENETNEKDWWSEDHIFGTSVTEPMSINGFQRKAYQDFDVQVTVHRDKFL